MKVSLIQLGYADDESSASRTERAAELVRAQEGADLVMLPELWHTGAFSFRLWEERAEGVDGPVARAMADAARDAHVVLHAGSVIERTEHAGPHGKHLWNTALVFDRDGSLVTTYRKMHRFCLGKESELLDTGEDLAAMEVSACAGGSLRAGLVTCYDIRFPEQFAQLMHAGVGMFLLPAAWPKARLNHWRVLAQARAIENQAYVLACNTAGTHGKQEMAGHSMVIAPDGTVLAEAGEGQEVLTAELDPEVVRTYRAEFPVLRDRGLTSGS